MRKIIILVVLFLSLIAIMPSNVSGEYIEIPSKVELDEDFTVSFDASYMASGEVYATIGLCDIDGNSIKDKDGYVIGVHWVKDYFVIGETPIKRDVNCIIKNQPEGTYKLKIVIYDKSSDESYPGMAKYTQTFELVEKEDSSSSSSCNSSVLLVIPLIIGLMIVIRKRY
jgi:hypothetical protein